MKRFWRVQNRNYSLDHESWPWGMSREEAEEQGLILSGVSCTDSAISLLNYFEQRGGVDDDLAEVIVFEGYETGTDPLGDGLVAEPIRIIARGSYSSLQAQFATWSPDVDIDIEEEWENAWIAEHSVQED